jgi:AcrR family transcriptional regulator
MNAKEKLLEAGITLARQRGYNNITCQEVADTAGVARTLIYYYFGCCDGMRSAVLVEATLRQELIIIAQAMAVRDPALRVSEDVRQRARKHL